MSLIDGKITNEGKYCIDCVWERHKLTCSDYPQCSHIKYRMAKNYSHRQTDRERYPFGSHVNPYGNCPLWELRRGIVTNLITIWNQFWGKEFKK